MGTLNIRKGSSTQRDGARGETIVLWYLRFRGYHLLDRNYRVGHKEIDLIMRKKDLVAFIEVKSRRKINPLMPPRLNVTLNKRHNIIVAARIYLSRKKLKNISYRFDIAEVDLSKRKVKYFENAYVEQRWM